MEWDKNRINGLLSVLTQAPVLTALLLICIFSFRDGYNGVIPFSVSLLLLAIIPAAIILSSGMAKGTGHWIAGREDRILPYVLILAVYLINTLFMYITNQPDIYLFVSLCYIVGTFAMFVLNYFTKISVHAFGTAMFSTILVLVFGLMGAIAVIIIPVVVWSRHSSKKHTMPQLIMGVIVGLTVPIVLSLLF